MTSRGTFDFDADSSSHLPELFLIRLPQEGLSVHIWLGDDNKVVLMKPVFVRASAAPMFCLEIPQLCTQLTWEAVVLASQLPVKPRRGREGGTQRPVISFVDLEFICF